MSEGSSDANLWEIRLPKLGESILSASVVRWLKKSGERVREDEPLLEVATDKVNSEIPSPVAGVLLQIYAKPGDEIEVGALLGVVGGATAQEEPLGPQGGASDLPLTGSKESFLSPAVKNLAKGEGVRELQKICGSGEGGRVTKRDLERHLADHPPPLLPEGESVRIPLTPMRKAIAANMVRSFYEAPHAYLVTEIDVTDLMGVIAREKERFTATHGAKLTLTAFLVHALAKAVETHSLVNGSFEGDAIVVPREVNVGIAVAIEEGLVVPVIRGCASKSIAGLAKEIADLSGRARQEELKPHEVAAGTITLTNFGMSGALLGLPIIRYPEVAIIGVGAIQKRLVVRDDDSLAIRQLINATLSFDHRVIDGMYAGSFMKAFKEMLESRELDKFVTYAK